MNLLLGSPNNICLWAVLRLVSFAGKVISLEQEKRNLIGMKKFHECFRKGLKIYTILDPLLLTNSVVQRNHLFYKLFYLQLRLLL